MKKAVIFIIALLFTAICAYETAVSAEKEGQSANRIVGKIVSVKDRNVNISAGRREGVKPKMLFDVYIPGRMVRVPLSKKEMLVREEKIGRIIITSVDETMSLGEFLDAANAQKLAIGLDVTNVPDSLAPEVNAPPVIKTVTFQRADEPLAKASVPCGTRVTVMLEIFDADDDFHFFDWTVSGGVLDAGRTTVPRNTWQAPMRPGTVILTVKVSDSSGGNAEKQVELASTGPENSRYPLAVTNLFGCGGGKYSRITDMAFDREGHILLLDGTNRQLAVMSESFAVITRSVQHTTDFNWSRAAVFGEMMYFLNTYDRKVYAFPYSEQSARDLFKDMKPRLSFGGAGASNGYFNDAVDLDVTPAGEVLVLDRGNPSVHKFSAEGAFLMSTGRKGNSAGEMARPEAFVQTDSGKLFVLDSVRRFVLVYIDMKFAYEFPLGDEKSINPADIAYNVKTSQVLVLDKLGKRAVSFSVEGKLMGEFCGKSGPELSRLAEPERIFTDYCGFAYVVESGGSIVLKYDRDGKFIGEMNKTDLSGVTRIAAGPEGELFLLDRGAYTVHVLDRDGWHSNSFGGYGAAGNKFKDPAAIGCDSEGKIYVLDVGALFVKKFDRQGNVLGAIGKDSGKLTCPIDMSVNGNRVVVLEDKTRSCVHVYDTQGVELDVLPKGEDVMYPFRVAVSPNGKVYVFDRTPQLYVFQSGTGASAKYKKNLDYVTGMAVDVREFLFAADSDRRVLTEIVPEYTGSVKHVCDKYFPAPVDVTTDHLGNVYVLDGSFKRIVKLSRQLK
jgi:hypothetical protein